ncbi:sodium-type flagellar protein [Candidatus Photodesmus blepharus]|uniref:Sodium-type flagellar protein n=1 Tax=Candidatus Photodesmus blepharonis TaxID=1179155 RepID=A0A084CN12_9GAMM|nr:OmpA family protein [Candidatus Photodesmus blepharus]KEY91191.1 sodium-type flagellar protein [Candidatus Photodesmus blepharus]
MKKVLVSNLLISLLSFQNIQAVEGRYVSSPLESQWNVVTNTPLECRLVHSIPNYGSAEFSSQASKKINLNFELKMRKPTRQISDVSLVSIPPYWRPGEAAEHIVNIKFFKQFDGYIGGETAWRILSELEDGRFPTFIYKDWESSNRSAEVALSSVLFQKEYYLFNTCIANLLPYSFEDISFTILHYNRNTLQLNEDSEKRLLRIEEYIRYSKDIDLVLISAYTDGVDRKNESQHLSEVRTKMLEEHFKSLGLPEDRIQAQTYGRRRPIADNSSPLGKNQNRRVVISLSKT